MSPIAAEGSGAGGLENVTLGEVYRLVLRLDSKVDLLGSHYVPIELWKQRNEQVDDRFESKGSEIADLRAELSRRHVPWTSVGAFAVAGIALVVNLIQSVG